MLISTGTNILDMELVLIDMEVFHLVMERVGRNIIIFGVDMSSSTKIDNRKKYILILGKTPTQGLEHTLSAEKMYSINFIEHNKKFGLSLHYNGANSLVMVKKFINLR